jgi:PadR family transcriptional regulator
MERLCRVSDQKRRPEGNLHSAGNNTNIEARPRNWLVPVTLVMLRQWSSYGYELMERIVELGFEAMNPGTLYRTLRNMEKEGLCESKWEPASAGPARRMYSITDVGEAYLDLWVKSLEHYQQTMDAFLHAYNSGGLRS